MRELREHEAMGQQQAQEHEAIIEPPPGKTQFAHGGEIPPVSHNTAFEPQRSAWAFDGGDQAPPKAPKPGSDRQAQQRTFNTGNGVYTVSYELVRLDRTDKPGVKQDAMKLRIVFNPSALVKSQNMGFVQVARRSQNGGEKWSTEEGGAMTGQRSKRTDEKSGFRVDRNDALSSPFYGTDYNDNGDLEAPMSDSNQIGRHPMMTDRPWITKNNHVEFVTTATDIDTGQQFDAITWGFRADGEKAEMIEPTLVAGQDDERLIGRDRAIHQWNELARNGANEDALPIQFDPVEDAKSLELAIPSKRLEIIRTTLDKHGTNRHQRSRIKQHYRYSTDRELSTDLKDVLGDKDEKKYKDWL